MLDTPQTLTLAERVLTLWTITFLTPFGLPSFRNTSSLILASSSWGDS